MKRRVLPILILPLLMMSSCTPTEPQYLESMDSFSHTPRSTDDITYLTDSVYVTFTLSFSEELNKKGFSHLMVLEKEHPNLLTEQALEEKNWLMDGKLKFRIPLRNQDEDEAFKTVYVMNHDIRVDYAFLDGLIPFADD